MRALGTITLMGAAALVMAGCAAEHSEPPPARSSHTPSSSARPHVVNFSITGDAVLTKLTYVIDGRSTTLKSVHLPWKKTVRLPAKAGKHTWRLASKQDDGASQIVVTVDGRPLTNTSCQGSGCTGHASGSVHD